MKPLFAALLALCLPAPVLAATACTAQSGPLRASILELYTSEGCSSCPPAERWLTQRSAAELAEAGWIPLAFHVDYWDKLGWRDPYAQAAYSARQRARGDRLGWVYTPQFLLDGDDLRPLGSALPGRAEAAGAQLKLAWTPQAGKLVTTVDATPTRPAPGAKLYLALYENRLTTAVAAGENAGRTLTHDYVVRALAGPFAPGRTQHVFALGADWQSANLGVAAWLETPEGRSLQALAAACQPNR